MKIMRKLAAALLAAALAAALAVPSLAAFDQDTLNGIVLIRTGAPDENGVMNYWRGTGFFVGEAGQDPEYIVTNCHVVEDFILAGKAIGGGELHVLFDQDDEAEAYLVDYDYEKDIAVLKLEEPTDKRSSLQLREVEDGMLGDEVYAVGYIPQLHQISLGHPRDGVENHFDAMIADFLEEEKDLPVPSQYVCGFLTIRLNDGRKLHLDGLRGNVVYKTGMAVRRGDVLGTVGYCYRGIKEPHINLSLSDTQSNQDDPMKPFGLRSTFIPPKETKAPETLTRAQALEDFGVLTACLQEAYSSLYDIIDQEEFAANDSTVRARLSEK